MLMCSSRIGRLSIRVLVKVPGIQTHRPAQRVVHWWWIGGAISMGDCRIIIRTSLPWTTMCNVFRECHAPCPLKTSFVDFEKKSIRTPVKQLQKTKCFVPTQLSQKSLTRLTHPFSHFYI